MTGPFFDIAKHQFVENDEILMNVSLFPQKEDFSQIDHIQFF